MFRSGMIALSVLAVAHPATAQQSLATSTVSEAVVAAEDEFGLRRGSFVAAPIPQSDPTLGSGLILGAGYLFKADEASDTSYFALGAMRTDNGSEAVGGAIDLSLGDGRWGIGLLFGRADINYELSLPGRFGEIEVPVNQTADIGKTTLSYGVSNTLTIGVEATWLRTSVRTNELSFREFPVLPGLGIDVEQIVGGPFIEWSTVDDTIFPTEGASVTLWAQRGVGLEGLDAEFWKYVLQAKGYTTVGERGVLATSSTACNVQGDAPFFNLCAIGLTDGLRGYPVGQFLGLSLASAQVEYRTQFTDRFGGAVFAGASAVGSDFGSLAEADLRGAAGIGLRYRLSQTFPLDFSIDGAQNSDGETTAYVYVGQSF